MFGIGLEKTVVNILHVTQHILLVSFAGTLSKSPVVNQYHVIIIPVKIPGIPRPSLNASCIAVEIEYQAGWLVTVKMQTVDPDAWFDIKKVFFKRNVIPELEIRVQSFRFEDKLLLQEIGEH